MDKYDSTPLDIAPYEPLINYGESVQYYKAKPRQSNMVAAYRIFAVVVIVGFVVGLYWRLS